MCASNCNTQVQCCTAGGLTAHACSQDSAFCFCFAYTQPEHCHPQVYHLRGCCNVVVMQRRLVANWQLLRRSTETTRCFQRNAGLGGFVCSKTNRSRCILRKQGQLVPKSQWDGSAAHQLGLGPGGPRVDSNSPPRNHVQRCRAYFAAISHRRTQRASRGSHGSFWYASRMPPLRKHTV